jgi:hypothetical protein
MEVGIRDADGEGDQNEENEELDCCHYVKKLNIRYFAFIYRAEVEKGKK